MIKHKKQNYRVVICTPAGREKYLSIFKKHIYRKMEEGLVDEWQLWLNTVDASDIAYLNSMANENPKVKIYRQGEPIDSMGFYETFNPLKTYLFFANAQDDDAVYIRFDDDIIWANDDAIKKIAKATLNNPNSFVTTPNIINSTVCNAYHQSIGVLSDKCGLVRQFTKSDPNYSYLHEFNYTDGRLCEHIHATFKENYEAGTLDRYFLKSRLYKHFERFSICSVAWLGKNKISLGYIEEPQIAWELPEALNRPNYFIGDALLVHMSYHTQRPFIQASGAEKTLLEFYDSITK